MAAKETDDTKKATKPDDTIKPSDFPVKPKAAEPEKDAASGEPTEPVRGKSFDPTLDIAPAGEDKIQPIDTAPPVETTQPVTAPADKR